MYAHQIQEELLYIMLYGAVAMMSLIAGCYLLFRRANTIAPDVTSSVRLRKWTAAFFVAMTLSHVWYLPILYLKSCEDIMMSYLVGAVLDFMTLIPSAIILLLVMLQDHRRPLWPAFVMSAPPIVMLAVCIASRSDALLPLLYAYYLLMAIGLIVYVVRATREYGRWLHENYADLEHKEVWQSLVVLAIILLVLVIYSFASKNMACKYIVQANNIILICYLLWRVETLSDLCIPVNDAEESKDGQDCGEVPPENTQENARQLSIVDNIGPLLKRFCEEPKLYLQYDF